MTRVGPPHTTGRRRGPSPLRGLVTLTLGLAAVAGLWLYTAGVLTDRSPGRPLDPGAGRAPARSTPFAPRIQPLTAEDRELLARQRRIADDLGRRHVGSPLSGRALDDLRILQQIVDRAGLTPDDTFQLQALGVALGDVLAAQEGLEWVVLDDDLGRSRALRVDDTDQLLFPVTMISKRVERSVPFRVDALYEKAVRVVEKARRGRGA
jgi:hypothetical protein